MGTGMSKMVLVAFIAIAVVIFGLTGIVYYQQYGITRCEVCGMEIMPEMDEHFIIHDTQDNRMHACCIGCALRLLDPVKGHEEIRIETFCDYYGPNYKIIIDAEEHGNVTTVTPDTARILLGAKVVQSCANNRIAYNQAAVDGLLEKGYSEYTMSYQHIPLPEGTPVVMIPMAAPMLAAKGIAYTPPSPLTPTLLLIVGIIVLVGSFVSYKKLKPA